jgi:hypothetical protein
MKSIEVKLRNIILWLGILLLAAGLFVAQVWRNYTYIKYTKNTVALKSRTSCLNNDIVHIKLDIEKLKDYKRLEKLAKERFSLVYAGVPNFIYRQDNNPVQSKPSYE